MEKGTKTILWVIVAMIVLLIAWAIYAYLAPTAGPIEKPTLTEPIVFGAILPLTGDASSYGASEKNSIEMAVEEINSQGGINGRLIEVVYEDGKCSGKDAANAAQKLVNVDKVKIILGGACSGETIAAAPISEEAKVILFSAFSSNPAISEMGDYIFRNIVSDKDVAMGMADVAAQAGNKIALITENTDFALGVRENILSKLDELRIKLVVDEKYNQSDTDFRTQLTKIKDANPDAVIVNPQASVGGLIIKQAKEMGIVAEYVGGYSFSGGDTMKAGGEAMNGVKFVDAPGLNTSNPVAQKFLTTYKEKYSSPASEWEAGARYDSVYILADAIKSCGQIDTDCIKDYLYDLKDYSGTLGTYHFNENGDIVGLKTYAIKQIIDAATEKIEVIEY